MHDQHRQLLAALSECAAACYHCSTACLEESDAGHMKDCIRLDMDCAQICQVTIAFISRGSDHAAHLVKECEEICRQCAEECRKHEYDHCKECAEACIDCADACSKF